MILRFLTVGRERGLNWETSQGVTVKSVLYNTAEKIAWAKILWETYPPVFINSPLALEIHKIKLKEAENEL